MTEIKIGTRVRVSYEATVRQIVGGGTYYVPPEEKLPGEASAWWLHPSRFEVIEEPLQVGDVVTADSPEPPDGSTIVTEHGQSARRCGEVWRVSWGDPRPWRELTRVHFADSTWTVHRVGDGAQ
jgi:hypothetical protein